MKNKKNILIIEAHPDDEVLGCGATMVKLAKEGHDVYSLILGEGVTSRDQHRDKGRRQKELDELNAQAVKANKVLGVKKVFTFDFPDNRFDTVALLDIIKTIEKIKKQTRPDVVFTHHHGDLNIDHQIACRAVMTAFRPLRNEKTKEIYSFEVPSSTEWYMPSAASYFMPNYFIDVSKSIKSKIRAMQAYDSEMRTFPHPRSAEAIETIARRWGINVGLSAAEAFTLVRSIRN